MKRNVTIWTKRYRMGIFPPLNMFKNGAVSTELKTASVKTKRRYKVKINKKPSNGFIKHFDPFLRMRVLSMRC